MKWIVTWIVINTWVIACPITIPGPDKYGVENQVSNTYAVACYESNETEKQKEFATHEEALKFVEEGEKYCEGIFLNCDLKDFVVKEIR